jgi:L-aminopeptidase/D-esterase-like protein
MAVEIPVEGIYMGHFTDREGLTGCTAILAPSGVVASVDIRGGAPGTLDSALLSPFSSVNELHGLLLTGGSAPGLGAAAGVTAFLRERGYGYKTPYARIPLVSGAVIYDLGLGSATACPLAGDAYKAAVGAGRLAEEGSVGVGTGASVGKLLGEKAAMKGGVAMASVRMGGGVVVCAFSVVNALGDVIEEDGSIVAGARDGGEFLNSEEHVLSLLEAPTFVGLESTTISVVITNATLDKVGCHLVARAGHDGMARAVSPVHTPVDGDCVFVMATGEKPSNVFQVSVGAARAVALSIRRAVKLADGVGAVRAFKDL